MFPGDPSVIGKYPLSKPPSLQHLFGTTAKGQDVLALTVWGSRASLLVGFVVGFAATLVAALVGLACAFFGRVTDDFLSLVTNVFLLIPGLPLLVLLAAFLPQGSGTVMFVLVLTGWAGAARVLRSQALSIRSKDFVAACLVTGERPVRIMFAEMLPNMASVVMRELDREFDEGRHVHVIHVRRAVGGDVIEEFDAQCRASVDLRQGGRYRPRLRLRQQVGPVSWLHGSLPVSHCSHQSLDPGTGCSSISVCGGVLVVSATGRLDGRLAVPLG